ncbi:MAG: thiol reductant ABC exporter subunit CydC [Bacteroidia bacterium]|nr:MAG: thiol reductant ABC exporter subunit CydC [Bacteroidia bacterium]
MTGRLLTYLKTHKASAVLAVLLATGTILAGMGLMTSSGYLISRAAERPMIVELFMITAAVRFFGISRAVVRYFERVVSHNLTFNILLRIRTSFYEQLNAFSQKWLMAKRPGELLTGMISDIETLQNVYLRIISPVTVSVIICSITFIMLLWIAVVPAFAVLGVFVANAILVPSLALYLSRGTGKTTRGAQGRMKVFLMENIQGMHDCLWLKNQEKIEQELDAIQQDISNVQHNNAASSGLVESLNQLFANLAIVISLILIIPLVLGGEIQAVLLAALVLGIFSSFEALQGLPMAFVQYDSFRESANSLRKLTDPGEKPDAQKPSNGIHIQGHPRIVFHHVSFAYDQEKQVLDDISFELTPGSRTAVVGPTGSGKSTLVNLFSGLWEPTEGEISVDNYPLGRVDMHAYRNLMSVVSQDTYIFNRSVRENLLIANAGADDAQLVKALKKVGLNALANNPGLVLGSLGMKLSGGERQLFALARALLKESRVWVFDELSANMDMGTERKILDALWKTLDGRTLLTITHRLVDMEKMDQILVMQDGRIAEKGDHKSLRKTNGLYAKMYDQQMELFKD